MKFEKISEFKLKVTISNQELLNNSDGDLDDFMSNPSKARQSFLKILDKAENEVGFHVNDSKIRIDAKSLYNGDFIFTITKLIPKKTTLLKAKPQKVANSKDNNYLAYSFNNLETFFNFCNFLKRHKINKLRDFCKEIELYKYKDKYILICSLINSQYEYLGKLYSCITEFGTFYSSQEHIILMIKEHSSPLIKHNAIYICQRNFK